MALVNKLQRVFEQQLQGDEEAFEFETEVSSSGQITGILTSSLFERKREYERQNMIWDVMEEELSEDELDQITIIIANTPDETAGLDEQQRLGDSSRRPGT